MVAITNCILSACCLSFVIFVTSHRIAGTDVDGMLHNLLNYATNKFSHIQRKLKFLRIGSHQSFAQFLDIFACNAAVAPDGHELQRTVLWLLQLCVIDMKTR